MTTASTPRFATEQTSARSIAAGLALVLTMGLVAGLDRVAEFQYDEAMVAQAVETSAPQVVVITAKRLQA
ncbi:hypothetical protein [Ideonella sp. YS5]|uniref:hypothetical protein n=1 Tax=Ideonella sp. YS5 TaxID=3453714 RepID=UPI003EEABB26